MRRATLCMAAFASVFLLALGLRAAAATGPFNPPGTHAQTLYNNPPPPPPPPAGGTQPAPNPGSNPAQPGGNPAQPGGNPAQPGGNPAQPGGNPAQPGGPAQPGDNPAQPGDIPAQPGGNPAQPGGNPAQPGGNPPAGGSTAGTEPQGGTDLTKLLAAGAAIGGGLALAGAAAVKLARNTLQPDGGTPSGAAPTTDGGVPPAPEPMGDGEFQKLKEDVKQGIDTGRLVDIPTNLTPAQKQELKSQMGQQTGDATKEAQKELSTSRLYGGSGGWINEKGESWCPWSLEGGSRLIGWGSDRLVDGLQFVAGPYGQAVNWAYTGIKPLAGGFGSYAASGDPGDILYGTYSGLINLAAAGVWRGTVGQMANKWLPTPQAPFNNLTKGFFGLDTISSTDLTRSNIINAAAKSLIWWGRNAFVRDPVKGLPFEK